MASITSLGVGSGLDSERIVSGLVAAERMPADMRLNSIEATTSARISAYGQIRASLSGLQDTLFKLLGTGSAMARTVTMSTGAGAGATATATGDAQVGSYQVTVEALATTHKLQSAQVTTGTHVGDGTLSISVGTDAPLDVVIAPGAGSLAQIRDAINAAAAGSGVTASIIQGDAGEVLTLSSGRSGAAGALTVTASGGDGGLGVLDTATGTMTTTAAAQDASVVVDGVRRTSATNVISDMVAGVTLTLTKADPAAFTMDIAADSSNLKASMLSFISAYNVSLNQLATQSKSSGTEGASGPLAGDSVTRGIGSTLRNTISANYEALSALGLKTAVDGTLTLDSAVFDAALVANPDAVKSLMGTEGTLSTALKTSVTNYIGAEGLVTSKTRSLTEKMEKIDQDRDRLDVRMEAIEARYRKQFGALDSLMAGLDSLNGFISQQMNAFNSMMDNK